MGDGVVFDCDEEPALFVEGLCVYLVGLHLFCYSFFEYPEYLAFYLCAFEADFSAVADEYLHLFEAVSGVAI